MVNIYLKLMMTAFFWGGTFIAGRLLAGNVGAFSAAFLRFAIASIFLLTLVIKTEGKIPMPGKGLFIPIILLGMTGVFSYNLFFFKGLQLIHAGRASLIIANNPIFITLFSAIIFKDRLNYIQIIGILLSVTGAMVVITRGDLSMVAGGGLGWGEIYILCCVASWVAYSLIGKAVLTNLSPLNAVALAAAAGTLALLFPALNEGLLGDLSSYSLGDWISLFYLGLFGTVIGFVWYYEGIRKIGTVKAGLFINFVPISAVILAFLILQEPLTFSLATGGLLVVSGVYLTNTSKLIFRRK